MINLIRANSSTPNIHNYHDARALRFAYGNNSGYVPGYGGECAITRNGTNMVIATGEMVHQGWQVELTTDTTVALTKPSSGAIYHLVYLKIDLSVSSTQKATIEKTSGSSLPALPTGDDLTTTKNGVGYLAIARATTTPDGISAIDSLLKKLPYANEQNETIKNALKATKKEGITRALTVNTSGYDYTEQLPGAYDYMVAIRIRLVNGANQLAMAFMLPCIGVNTSGAGYTAQTTPIQELIQGTTRYGLGLKWKMENQGTNYKLFGLTLYGLSNFTTDWQFYLDRIEYIKVATTLE